MTKDFSRTYSGGRFYPLHLMDSDINLNDIAMALSKQCRFNGHCKGFYSVAQHSVLVSRLVPAEYAREGLMHDAAEAYIGDLVAPVKKLCPDYKDMEEMVEAEIAEVFNLKFPMPSYVKEADIVAVVTEKRDLLEGGSWGYYDDIKPHPHTIIPLCWEDAYVEFIERAEDLGLI